RTRAYVWITDSATNTVLTSTIETSVDGLHTWQVNFGLTNETVTTYIGAGERHLGSKAPDSSYTLTISQSGRPTSTTRYESDSLANQLSATTFGYDPHGRRNESSDARNGTTTFWFNNADQVSSTRTPSPDGTLPGLITTNFFD